MPIHIGPKMANRLARFTWWLQRKRGVPLLHRIGPLEIGELCEIPGGDGEPDFFIIPRRIRLTEADWFPGRLIRGEALLFLVEGGGKYGGKYVALTTRVLAPLRDQLVSYGNASVVVHLINNPTSSFDGSERDADPFGMAVVVRS